jgi:hypothetical protein
MKILYPILSRSEPISSPHENFLLSTAWTNTITGKPHFEVIAAFSTILRFGFLKRRKAPALKFTIRAPTLTTTRATKTRRSKTDLIRDEFALVDHD